MNESPRKLWAPSASFIADSNLVRFTDWLAKHKSLQFNNYQQLHHWSVSDLSGFWKGIWEYFRINCHSQYTSVLADSAMPGAEWFEGATLNYTEHLFRNPQPDAPAIIFSSEKHPLQSISWDELKEKVGAFREYLISCGIRKGDRVVAFLPNCPEAIIGFMACNSLGAIWSSCSPDFGVESVLDRFAQIEPRVLITCDGYSYNGKSHSRIEHSRSLVDQLPGLEHVVWVPFNGESPDGAWKVLPVLWEDSLKKPAVLDFEPVPFNHPIWILYSSGTTGKPKAITHSHGGALLEHLKYLTFHNDVKPGEKFFWYSTTGWMMWNYSLASMLLGATLVLYDGSPAYPDINVLWELAEKAGIHHFGTSAPYIVACLKANLKPGDTFDLSSLRSIGSTGAPLPPEGFDWVYSHVKKDLWLCSMSGGTDVCTAFVGGCPTRPVYEGEIQCRALGCDLLALDEDGMAVTGKMGEMVIRQAMPSMPIYFWNDPDMARYKASYFEEYPGMWRHGDWIEITERDGLVIYGRSDATLNRQGVRIGTAEIYSVLDGIPDLADTLIVNLELKGGDHFMPLFVKTIPGVELTEELKDLIRSSLRQKYTPRHVPDDIIQVPDIPYTISGKKMEAPVKKILMGFDPERAANLGAMRNPDSLDFFIQFAMKVNR